MYTGCPGRPFRLSVISKNVMIRRRINGLGAHMAGGEKRIAAAAVLDKSAADRVQQRIGLVLRAVVGDTAASILHVLLTWIQQEDDDAQQSRIEELLRQALDKALGQTGQAASAAG